MSNSLLWHYSNQASGLTTWPGCISPALRMNGWPNLIAEAELAQSYAPNMGGILIDNPFGKYVCRETYPNVNPAAVQTLMDQYLRCVQDTRLRQVCRIDALDDAINTVRSYGLDLEVYMGWLESDVDSARLGAATWPLLVNKLPIWVDGLAVHPDSNWIVQTLKNWGAPFVGAEAAPSIGDPMDRSDLPSISLEVAFMAQGGRESARRRRGKSSMIWRGPTYMPLTDVISIMGDGIRIYTGLANWHNDAAWTDQINQLNAAAVGLQQQTS